MTSVNYRLMDFNRSSNNYRRTDEDTPIDALSIPTDQYTHQSKPAEHGGVFDSDDDLSLGTDAQVFSMSETPQISSPGSSSISTGYNFESSSESTGYPASHMIVPKLNHMARLDSTESSLSDLSDISRTSHDVSSLLNAMSVDPEEFLADLGFAESDMSMRIPDRFLEAPSKAHGIDVEFYRRSFDQEDLYGGSPSQDSPVWSDPGSSRIPLRFISHTDPISPVLIGGCSSIPLIAEPEEAPEDSFDLMRHLRLNKPQHVTKGMFLEPLTEELEVSSVGSGTVRTKISRKLSNEEGTIIIREESFEQGNLESELSLDVPITGHEQVGFDSNELKETTVSEQVENESQIVVNLEAEEATSISHAAEGVMDCYSAQSSSDVVDLSTYSIGSQQCTSSSSECSDNNKQDLSRDVGANGEEEVIDISPGLAVPAHLKVTSIVVQDSFELEEIGNEEFNEKESSSTDQESGLILVKSLEKRLTRENSGESSGFEEMLPDKESASPNSSSPVLNTKRLPAVSRDLISDRRPLEALLDREMLSLAVEEKSPRATFGQRRTKSLTKQRPIDEDTFASWATSPRSSAPNYVAESLGTSISHEASTVTSGEDTEPSFPALSAAEPVIDYWNSELHGYVGETDENYNRTSKNGPEKLSVTVEPSALEKSDSSLAKRDTATAFESFEDATLNNGSLQQDNNSTAIKLSELSSCLQNEMAHNGEESISPLTKEEFNSQRNITENKEYVLNKTDATFAAQGDAINTHIEQQTQSSRDVLSRGKLLVTSLPEDNEAVGACAEVRQREESQKALRKVDSEYQQHYLHEINVLEQSIQKYESNLSSEGPLDRVRTSNYTKHMLVRITEEVNAIQELRVLISSELERMKCLLSERRKMLLVGATRSLVCCGVTQKMADLLREQSSLTIGLSDISDELSIRKKASRRARICAHIDSVKKELKEEREKCVREFREEIKEALTRDLSERFSSEIDLLRHEVRSKDAVIEQLMKNQEQRDLKD